MLLYPKQLAKIKHWYNPYGIPLLLATIINYYSFINVQHECEDSKTIEGMFKNEIVIEFDFDFEYVDT